MIAKNGMRPIHPGEILQEEFLRPMGISAHALALALHVPAPRINALGGPPPRRHPADAALRLARYFGTSENFWLGLQADYDAAHARIALADVLPSIQPRAQVA